MTAGVLIKSLAVDVQGCTNAAGGRMPVAATYFIY